MVAERVEEISSVEELERCHNVCTSREKPDFFFEDASFYVEIVALLQTCID